MAPRIHSPVFLLCSFLALALLPLAAARAADDEAALEAAKQLVDELTTARKAKDVSALETLLKRMPEVHNGIEHKGTRGKLLKLAGDCIDDKKLEGLSRPAIEALSAVDDPKGAWKELRRYLPSPKDKEPMTDTGKAVLEALAKLVPDQAIDPLLDLVEKTRDYDAGALALGALGNYKTSKKRTAILESLVKLIARFQPPRGQQIGAEAEKRWTGLGAPLLNACNAITGRRTPTPDAWLQLWKENKRRPEALFPE